MAGITDGQTKTSATADEIRRAGEAIQSIVNSIANINGMNTQIATAAEEQSVVAESITENIISISNLSEDTVNKVQENHATAESLTNISGNLNQQISIYKSS